MHSIKAVFLSGSVEKALGLLAFKKPRNVLIKTRFGIHTFGMHYPIDIIVMDKKHRVKAVKKILKPNRIYIWNPAYDTVLELPQNEISKLHVHIGDDINIIQEFIK